MFNTGDLGRWRDNGELEHLGRVDDQVKVKVSQLHPPFCAECLRERRLTCYIRASASNWMAFRRQCR